MMSAWGKSVTEEFCQNMKIRVCNSTLGGTRNPDDFDLEQVFAIGEDTEMALNAAMQKQMTAGATGDRRGKALGLIKAADALATMGKHNEAREQANEAVAICQEFMFDEGKSAAMNVMARATVATDKEELQDAQGVATDSLKLSQKLGFKKGEAAAYATQASLHQAAGEGDKCIVCAKQAMALFSELGEQVCVAEMFLTLCKGYLVKRETAKAAKRIRKAIEVLNKLGDRATEAKCWHIIAMVEFHGNDLAKGTSALEEASNAYLELSNFTGYGDVMDTKIDYLMSRQQFAEAVGVAKAKVKAFNGNDMRGEAMAMSKLAELYINLGQNEQANKAAGAAMEMFAGLNDIEGMKSTKGIMDGVKHAQVCEQIAFTIESNKEYMHVPEGLIIDPGMNKRVVATYQEIVNNV